MNSSPSPKPITIVVNGQPHKWEKGNIAFFEVVGLEIPDYQQHPDVTYTVTYSRGHGGRSGILAPGAEVKAHEGMVFNVSETGQS